jgi:hypothetical protein
MIPHRREMVAAIVAISFVCSAAFSQSGEQLAMDHWRSCVLETARRYAKSSDPADIVARGALIACREREIAVDTALRQQQQDLSGRVDILEKIGKKLTDSAILTVLELRSGPK